MNIKQAYLTRLLAFGVLLLGLVSCTEEPKPQAEVPVISKEHPSNAQIAQVINKAAEQAVLIKMRAISPNTGRSPKYAYSMDDINYDKQAQQASVSLKITWTAKRTELSSTRNTCQMDGILYLHFVNRADGVVSATYTPTSCNDWLKQCLNYYGTSEKEALKSISFNPYD